MTQRSRAWIDRLCFAAGCAVAVVVAVDQLSPVISRFALIPGLVDSQQVVLAHGCRDEDCARCVGGLESTSGAMVLTSGSSFRRGLDVDLFRASMPVPVVDCMRNDSRLDAYQLFFAYKPATEARDSVLHAYNSWAINSPGTWRNANAASFFAAATATSPGQTFWERLALYRLYAHLFLVRVSSEVGTEWRSRLRYRIPGFEGADAAFWPLSRNTHLDRKVDLMRRWFDLSPYVRSFVIEADRVRPREEIEQRHHAFFLALSPVRRVVFVRAPEMVEVFPARLRHVVAESKQVMLDVLAEYRGVRHVEIDYAACGVVRTDFWSDSHMLFDMGHNAAEAQPKITQCVTDALRRAGIPDFLAAE